MEDYIPRLIDDVIKQKMNLYGAVAVMGPKGCGKTTTCLRFSKSSISFQNSAEYENNKVVMETNPSSFLNHEKPLLIDEWQVFPQIWDAIKCDVDENNKKGEYLLNGFSTATKGPPWHSKTDEVLSLAMRPMSLYESGESNGCVSLKQLFEGKNNISGMSQLEVEDYAFLITRGGWPETVKAPKNLCFNYARDYIHLVRNFQIEKVVDSSSKIERFLNGYAKYISTSASMDKTYAMKEYENLESIQSACRDHSNISYRMEDEFIVDDTFIWRPQFSHRFGVSPGSKREFVDPSLAMAVLGLNDKDLLKDFDTFESMFVGLCVRDLKIYAESIDGQVYFYLDNVLNCDAIIQLDNGKWGAVGIQLGDNFDKKAKELLEFSDAVDKKAMGSPSFLMILTATKYVFKREDGILVVPLGCLRN